MAATGVPQGTGEAESLVAAYSDNLQAIELIEDAYIVLEAVARRVPVVVISNFTNHIQAAKLRHHGLERFVAELITPETIDVSKPDPRVFAHANAITGVASEFAVHIGDSLASDVLGTNTAECASVLRRAEVPHDDPVPNPSPVPTATIDRLSELPALLGLD